VLILNGISLDNYLYKIGDKMKKIINSLMVLSILAFGLFAKEIDLHDKKTIDKMGLYLIQSNKDELKDSQKELVNWFIVHDRESNSKYNKINDDEFELDAFMEDMTANISKKISKHRPFSGIGKTTYIRMSSSFEKYNFTKKGFPINGLSKHGSFSYGGQMARAKVYFDNINESYSFLPMQKSEAKALLKSRTSGYGNVNRELIIKYTFVIKNIESDFDYIRECYKQFNCFPEQYEIIGHLTKVEILGKNNSVLYTYSDLK